LITNAVREVAELDPARRRVVGLGVDVQPRWTHLQAVDTAPGLPEESHLGLLAGSGRGIPIITSLSAMTWIDQGEESKTVHVVLTRTGVGLTPHDRKTLNPHRDP
jgi:hypothetical protein